MRPSFNTAGPCNPGEHYMLPPERRLKLVMKFIEEHKYFTLTAGRQTGKTTCARWLEDHYNATGDWHALWVDIQTAREQPDPATAFRVVLDKIASVCKSLEPPFQPLDRTRIDELVSIPQTAILHCLSDLAARDDKRWVIFFDEADGLVGEAMVSFLTQLRDGYINRSKSPFPASVVLVGQRQVRDYALREEDRRVLAWLGTSSPFNITAKPATLDPFTESEVAELLQQHTDETGQVFLPEAVAKIYELGQGHPWLTNALADQIVNYDVEDRAIPITVEDVEAAKETIIIERRSHIDSLVARLREPRVRRILDPMLEGALPDGDMLDDDIAYCVGLGLLRKRAGGIEIANPIYREVIPRTLTYAQQVTLPQQTAWYVRPDGSLDMGKLMQDWQMFWREDGHLAAEGFSYRESGPHLMLMAFLQRIINGGGRITREYGLGRKALDLLIFWKDERHAIEVKIRRDSETETRALDQVAGYLDRLGESDGWMVMFDMRKEVAWNDKLFVREVDHAGKHIRLVGC
ncbi:MAG: ATP-binding protein [Polyangiaceae bacterium]|nr:ATP-binding protein [Polyangiaceae bacterium]